MLKKILAEIVAAGKASGESWRITKAKCFAAQMEKMSIDVSPLDWFPAIAIWYRNDRPISTITKRDRAREVMDTMTNYTDDPAVLYPWRNGMADLIEEASRK